MAKGDVVRTHFGIKGDKIVMAHESNDGKITVSTHGGGMATHSLSGRPAKNELHTVFGISDSFHVPVGMEDAPWVMAKCKDLEEKLEKQRAETEARKKDQEENS